MGALGDIVKEGAGRRTIDAPMAEKMAGPGYSL